MRIYIAGPMTGYDLYNFPAFDAAEARLEAAGHTAVNPAAKDREDGFDEHIDLVTPPMLRRVLARDLADICKCDGIAVLDGWQRSMGACIEVSLAARLGLFVFDAETLEDVSLDVKEYIEWRLLG
jgi:nucleoside 2-deoxyribosyltransferase